MWIIVTVEVILYGKFYVECCRCFVNRNMGAWPLRFVSCFVIVAIFCLTSRYVFRLRKTSAKDNFQATASQPIISSPSCLGGWSLSVWNSWAHLWLVRTADPYCSKAQYGSASSTAKSINRKNRTSQTASLRMVSLEKIHAQWLIERRSLLPMLATREINQIFFEVLKFSH